jgi:twitching motility two-component system response regulator PilG
MKVLLVDDTRTLLSLIQVYLMGWSITFVEAKDGLDGLRKARESRPDLVISDVRMPGMDGFELTAAIRSDVILHHTPVILLTSLNDEASRRKGRLVGATAFLSKPVSVEELRRQVSTLLKLPVKQPVKR